ncbi:YoaK family protein [Pedobacter sp. MR2016-24]|uniref:YoaK family protein n=1 Tax=Pedobacter sp. MR2016-24 TaxID=2994466 RepID=UPI0022459313|nr:YoaK family protein [Pedobacter sp. MR2016-24]MCX2483792.1 YoaK family protein [Pedobacter sp. MR2016-24]
MDAVFLLLIYSITSKQLLKMLRHSGTRRSAVHNLRLATLLGLTAGMVNAEGFLGFSILTTNVTGHAALFAEKISLQDWHSSIAVALWMLLFFAGAFLTSLILSVTGNNRRFSYFIPIIIEISILLFSALCGSKYDGGFASQGLFAGSLLFAMGIQNALVSMVSGSVVRTTHLTGTFTDLGIELAQLIGAEEEKRVVIKSKIKLHTVIIFFFMTGAVSGAYLFHHIGFRSFYAPVFILCFALLYDLLRIKVERYYHVKTHTIRH